MMLPFVSVVMAAWSPAKDLTSVLICGGFCLFMIGLYTFLNAD